MVAFESASLWSSNSLRARGIEFSSSTVFAGFSSSSSSSSSSSFFWISDGKVLELRDARNCHLSIVARLLIQDFIPNGSSSDKAVFSHCHDVILRGSLHLVVVVRRDQKSSVHTFDPFTEEIVKIPFPPKTEISCLTVNSKAIQRQGHDESEMDIDNSPDQILAFGTTTGSVLLMGISSSTTRNEIQTLESEDVNGAVTCLTSISTNSSFLVFCGNEFGQVTVIEYLSPLERQQAPIRRTIATENRTPVTHLQVIDGFLCVCQGSSKYPGGDQNRYSSSVKLLQLSTGAWKPSDLEDIQEEITAFAAYKQGQQFALALATTNRETFTTTLTHVNLEEGLDTNKSLLVTSASPIKAIRAVSGGLEWELLYSEKLESVPTPLSTNELNVNTPPDFHLSTFFGENFNGGHSSRKQELISKLIRSLSLPIDIPTYPTQDSTEFKQFADALLAHDHAGIVYYFLQCQAEMKNMEDRRDLSDSFESQIKLSSGVKKLFDGYFAFDSGNFQEAFKIFADPTVQPSNPGEIISSFIDVGHEDLALRLAQVLQVPLGVESHFLVIIEVFVQNGALLGAFNFLRKNRQYKEKGFRRLFELCFKDEAPKHALVTQIFDLPLDNEEESILVNHLKTKGMEGSQICQNLLVLFLTNRNRYIEAIQEHERFVEKFPYQETNKARKVIIENLRLVLPRVQKELLSVVSSKKMEASRAPIVIEKSMAGSSSGKEKELSLNNSLSFTPRASPAPQQPQLSATRPLSASFSFSSDPMDDTSRSLITELVSNRQITNKSPSGSPTGSDYVPLASPPPSPTTSPNRRSKVPNNDLKVESTDMISKAQRLGNELKALNAPQRPKSPQKHTSQTQTAETGGEEPQPPRQAPPKKSTSFSGDINSDSEDSDVDDNAQSEEETDNDSDMEFESLNTDTQTREPKRATVSFGNQLGNPGMTPRASSQIGIRKQYTPYRPSPLRAVFLLPNDNLSPEDSPAPFDYSKSSSPLATPAFPLNETSPSRSTRSRDYESAYSPALSLSELQTPSNKGKQRQTQVQAEPARRSPRLQAKTVNDVTSESSNPQAKGKGKATDGGVSTPVNRNRTRQNKN